MVLYTAVGGLKATFLTDFLHTAIALILIIYFTIAVLTNSEVGGLGGLYDKVVATAADNYIPENYQGSLLTFKSKGAIIWGLILKFGNLALVVMVSIPTGLSEDTREKPPMRCVLEANILLRTLRFGKSHLPRRYAPQYLVTTSLHWPSSAFHGAWEPSSG